MARVANFGRCEQELKNVSYSGLDSIRKFFSGPVHWQYQGCTLSHMRPGTGVSTLVTAHQSQEGGVEKPLDKVIK